MSRNLCNCPNCQTDNCPAARELAEARKCLREMRDMILRMNFGHSFPAITRAIENANSILEAK
jgi:hypothetical protein